MKNIYKILLVLILLLNLFLRVYGLEKSPATVNFDEAALGYNAYSIYKTGKDEYGNWMPLSLRSFNDYKPALYSYLTIPFIHFFGLNQTSTRLVSAIAGTISIVFIYLFICEFIKNRWLSLFLFFVISLQPWRLHFSRVAFESNLSAMFFIAASWFLYKNRDWKNIKNKWAKLVGVSVLFALSAYSYHSARLAAPALILLWIIDPFEVVKYKKISQYFKWIFKEKMFGLVCLFSFILLILPVFMANQSKLVLTRFKQENVFNRYYPYSPKELVGELNPFLNLQNNPIYYFGGIMTGHVLSYVSPINLGNRIYPWINNSAQYIPSFAMFGWIESMLFLVGFIYLVSQLLDSFKYRYVLYWMIAGAAPAALTWNWFHSLRSLNIFPAIEIIICLGFFVLYQKIQLEFKYKKIVYFLTIILFSLSTVFTVVNEYGYSVAISHGEYQPGSFKEGVPVLKKIQDKYDQVIIDSPHAQSYIFFLFYQSFPPEEIQKYANIRPKPGIEGNLNFNFYKYKFEKFDWPKQNKYKNTIFWTSSEVKEEEIKNVQGTSVVWLKNAVKDKASAIITKE